MLDEIAEKQFRNETIRLIECKHKSLARIRQFIREYATKAAQNSIFNDYKTYEEISSSRVVNTGATAVLLAAFFMEVDQETEEEVLTIPEIIPTSNPILLQLATVSSSNSSKTSQKKKRLACPLCLSKQNNKKLSEEYQCEIFKQGHDFINSKWIRNMDFAIMFNIER